MKQQRYVDKSKFLSNLRLSVKNVLYRNESPHLPKYLIWHTRMYLVFVQTHFQTHSAIFFTPVCSDVKSMFCVYSLRLRGYKAHFYCRVALQIQHSLFFLYPVAMIYDSTLFPYGKSRFMKKYTICKIIQANYG